MHTCRAAQEKKFKDKVKSELRGAVSKAFIIKSFGLGPSNQVNSTTGLTLCPVATIMGHVQLKNHIPIELESRSGESICVVLQVAPIRQRPQISSAHPLLKILPSRTTLDSNRRLSDPTSSPPQTSWCYPLGILVLVSTH